MKLVTFLAGMVLATSAGAFARAEEAAKFGDCKLVGPVDSVQLKTLTEDTLTVGTVLPNPGWWNGNSATSINGGFEYCMAAEIAYRAGFHHLEIKTVAWDQLISGASTGYDLAIASVTITDKRKAVMNFSVPYYHENNGVAVRANSDVNAENIRQKRIGVVQGSTNGDWVIKTLKPDSRPSVFQNLTDVFTALSANQVDAVISDTSLALNGASKSHGLLTVVGQYKVDQSLGIVVPKDSANQAAIDKVVTQFQSDGILAKLTDQYLTPVFGGNPDRIAFWEAK